MGTAKKKKTRIKARTKTRTSKATTTRSEHRAKVRARNQARAGTKTGAKTGARVGTKDGTKAGTKARSKTGTQTRKTHQAQKAQKVRKARTAQKASWPDGPVQLFVASAPGVEALLEAELKRLTKFETKAVPGGVELEGDATTLYRIALGSGLGTHLMVRLGAFSARRFEVLVRKTAKLPFRAILGDDVRFEVTAKCRKSRLHHTGAVAERVTTAIAEARGYGQKSGPLVAIQCRIEHDEVTLSLDLTGEPLWKRGYRSETAKAPLREDLALALVLSSGWDPTTPLIDPFCGSGTILIEAARHALGLLPGSGRNFLFETLPFFDRQRFLAARDSLEAEMRRPDAAPDIRGADRDAGAMEAARNNADRGQVGHVVTVEQAAISKTTVFDVLKESSEKHGAVVSNPPHGHRVGDPRTLQRLYQSLGHRIGELPDGCPVAVLVRDARTARSMGVPLETRFLTDQGGSKVRVLAGVTGARTGKDAQGSRASRGPRGPKSSKSSKSSKSPS